MGFEVELLGSAPAIIVYILLNPPSNCCVKCELVSSLLPKFGVWLEERSLSVPPNCLRQLAAQK